MWWADRSGCSSVAALSPAASFEEPGGVWGDESGFCRIHLGKDVKFTFFVPPCPLPDVRLLHFSVCVCVRVAVV